MILYIKDKKKLYPKTSRHHKQLQKHGRIQNQITKIIFFSTHQQRTNWERIYGNNSTYNSLHKKKIKYLGVNFKKDVKDLYKEN
jgi:hypothetical protein